MIPPPVAHLLAQAAPPRAGEIDACGPAADASSLCRAIYRATGNQFVASMADTVIVKPAKVLLILALAFVVNRLMARAIRRFVRSVKGEKVQRGLATLREHAATAMVGTDEVTSVRSAQRAETIGALLRSISAFSVWVVAALMVMGELGLALGPLIAGAGIVGIALGFGAQNLVRDFISGIFMLVEDQYGVGDVIDAGPASGTVEAVTLRTTRLRDVNGVVWHIPNGNIERIGNKSQQWSRALLDFEVAYDTDVDFAGDLIKRTIVTAWDSDTWRDVILEEPEVWGVENLGADGVTIRVAVKTLPGRQFPVARHLRAQVKAAFEGAGIEIPFPQRMVWHRTAGAKPPMGVPSALGDGDGDGDQAERVSAGLIVYPRSRPMDIVRNADGTLVVPVPQERRHDTDDGADTSSVGGDDEATQTDAAPATRLLHPGEGGYDEALAEWDLQQNPDRGPVVSTATGRQEAMTLVHAVATAPDVAVAPAVEALDDPGATGEALRHVLVGGVHSVEDFAAEVAEAEGGDPLPAHQMTKIIGKVLAELDR